MSPEEELRFLILGAQREGNRFLAALLAPLDLTPSQAEVLRCLADAGPLSLNALGRRLVCETGSPSRLVSTMVERGWIVRREDSRDRRQVTLTLTGNGRRLAGAVQEVERQLYGWMRQRLDGFDVARLSGALRSLLDGSAAGKAIAERQAAASAAGGQTATRRPKG